MGGANTFSFVTPKTWKEMVKRCEEEQEHSNAGWSKTEGEMEALRAELVKVEKKKREAEDVEMGGSGSPSQEVTVDAATNTESGTYAQAGSANTSRGREGEGEKKGPNTAAAKSEMSEILGCVAGPLQGFAFVEDLIDYEEEVGEEEGTMTKAVVVHGVPTN